MLDNVDELMKELSVVSQASQNPTSLFCYISINKRTA